MSQTMYTLGIHPGNILRNIMQTNVILHAENISKSFDIDQKKMVIANINMKIMENEIVAFLGKSGTGKSTFLRIMSGLSEATTGKITCMGEIVTKPCKYMSMVFQQFALLPWLTVFDNVAFGLEALGLPKDEIKTKTLNMIETIGLGGYENSYPKELSGGMKQRVGFARALVVEPELLLLDEPFSALDIYTSHKVRQDMIDLWENKKINTKSMVLVTHNVEEAVMMSDRILVWGSHPGTIREEFIISEPRSNRTKRNMFDTIENISKIHHDQIADSEKKVKNLT